MNATEPHAYVVNLLLHTALLSLLAFGIANSFRNPHARSMSVAFGLLALSVIPWISALRVPATAAVEIPIAPVRIFKPSPAESIAPQQPGTVVVGETVQQQPDQPKLKLPDPWTLLAGIWALGCAVQIIRQSAAAVHLARWKNSLRQATGSEFQTLREQSPGITDACRILISKAGTSPCVTGIFRPTLVLPENLLASDPQRELNWAVRHETGHLRGHDLLWLALFQLILAVQWWNPFSHHLVRIWADAREQVCDHLAVTDPQDRAEYGTFIVSLGARRMTGATLAMANRGTVTRLKRRIRFLMEAKTYLPCGRGFVAGGMLSAILIGQCVSLLGVKAETPFPQQEPAQAMPVENKVIAPEIVKKDLAVYPYKPFQIKCSSKLIVTSEPLPRARSKDESGILSEEQMQVILGKLARTPNTDLMTAPSVTVRPKQKAMLEIIRENPENPKATKQRPVAGDENSDTHQYPSIDDPDYKFAGFRMEYVADFSGDEIKLNFKLALGHIPGTVPGKFDNIPKQIPWKTVRQYRADGQGLLKTKQALFIPVGEIEPGRYATLIVTVISIDATGRPVGEPEALPDESGNDLDETNSSNQQEPEYPRAIVVPEP